MVGILVTPYGYGSYHLYFILVFEFVIKDGKETCKPNSCMSDLVTGGSEFVLLWKRDVQLYWLREFAVDKTF